MERGADTLLFCGGCFTFEYSRAQHDGSEDYSLGEIGKKGAEASENYANGALNLAETGFFGFLTV